MAQSVNIVFTLVVLYKVVCSEDQIQYVFKL